MFTRDRYTWLAYILLGYFSFIQSLLGPIMPFLRTELNLSYMTGSLHLSACALGMVIIGITGDRVLQRFGARRTLWVGAAGMAVCAALLATGSNVVLTLTAAAFQGMFGTLLVMTQQATLAQHHGERSVTAFAEGNILASLTAMFAPLLLGLSVANNMGWRLPLLLPLPIILVLLVTDVRRSVPEPEHTHAGTTSKRLPPRFWAFWLVTLMGVAVEWCFGFFGADYLYTNAGLPIDLAVTAMSVFFLAMTIGRILGSRLSYLMTPEQLLAGASVLSLIGALLFWQVPNPMVAVVGLGLAGVGVGNMFPFSLSAALRTAPHLASLVSSRVLLASGTAILLAPLALGSIADRIGLNGAFTIVPVFLLAALGIIIATQMAQVRKRPVIEGVIS